MADGPLSLAFNNKGAINGTSKVFNEADSKNY